MKHCLKNIILLTAVMSFAFLLSCGSDPIVKEESIADAYEDFNVILIVMDTLRYDHLGCYGYSKDITPNIDKLAEKSSVFNNAFSASSWTRSSLASLLTSKLPLEHGIYSEAFKEKLKGKFLTIQKFFKQINRTTAALYTNAHYKFGLDNDFDWKFYKSDMLSNHIYQKAVNWIEDNKQAPFFLLIHNNDPHDPWRFHKDFSTTPKLSKYRRLENFFPQRKASRNGAAKDIAPLKNTVILNDEELSEMIANYDAEIAFMDHQLGKMLDYLKESGIDEKTIIILTADHGKEFLDHGGYWHGCTLYNELIHVPLIMRFPGMAAQKIDERISTIDLFPTLTKIYAPETDYDFSGASLWPLLSGKPWNGKPIFSATAFRSDKKYSLIMNDYKLIKSADGSLIGVYNISRDPKEKTKLDDNKILKSLEYLMTQLIKVKLKNIVFENIDKDAIDPAILKQLRDLGY